MEGVRALSVGFDPLKPNKKLEWSVTDWNARLARARLAQTLESAHDFEHS
jgi:hypothetical protein